MLSSNPDLRRALFFVLLWLPATAQAAPRAAAQRAEAWGKALPGQPMQAALQRLRLGLAPSDYPRLSRVLGRAAVPPDIAATGSPERLAEELGGRLSLYARELSRSKTAGIRQLEDAAVLSPMLDAETRAELGEKHEALARRSAAAALAAALDKGRAEIQAAWGTRTDVPPESPSKGDRLVSLLNRQIVRATLRPAASPSAAQAIKRLKAEKEPEVLLAVLSSPEPLLPRLYDLLRSKKFGAAAAPVLNAVRRLAILAQSFAEKDRRLFRRELGMAPSRVTFEATRIFAKPEDGKAPRSFDDNLDLVLRDGALFTLAGIKPVTDAYDWPEYDLGRIWAGLEKARRAGRYRNANLGWIYDGNALQFINREAVRRLQRDPKALALLEPYGYKAEEPAEAWIDRFKKSRLEPYIPYQDETAEGVYDGHVVSGLFYGFPPREVEAYSRRGWLRKHGLGRDRKPGRFVRAAGTAYRDLTGRSEKENAAYLRAAEAAQRKYAALRAAGHSAWEILNRWDEFDTSPRIVAAGADDFDRLMALQRNAFPKDGPWLVGLFSDLMSWPGARVDVVRSGEGLAGGIISAPDDDDKAALYIWSLAVAPGHREQGLGEALLRRTLDAARADPQIKRVRLHARAGNAPAIFLYRRFGFKTVATVEKFYKDEDALLLSLILSA